MQVNMNNINSNENITSAYKPAPNNGAGSIVDVKISDEYTISNAQNLAEDQIITRVKQNESDPMSLTSDNINKLARNIGADDFSKYEELGITPEEDELGRVVTVSDRIKIELATHCENYTGDVSDISASDLENITGSTGNAYVAKHQMQTLEMARELKNIDDNTKSYLLKNEMQPTIENVYMAEHSGTSSNVSKLSEDEWNELKPQVEAICEKAGLTVSEEMLDEGRFLIEHGISLTAQNVVKSMEMNTEIEGRSDEQWMKDIAKTVALGMNEANTNAVSNVPDKYMAEDIINAIENGDEEQIEAVISSGKELTILNLKTPPTVEEIKEKINNDRIVAVKDKLQEIRQKMSFEACITMMKNGIKIEVMPFDELSVQLDEYDEKNTEVFFDSIDKTKSQLFNDVLDAMETMKSVPSAVLGKVASGEAQFTVNDINEAGINLAGKYEEAETLYSAVGTEVRTDLGDTIKAAFDSSYGVLEELGIEDTESARRAVRILGYNSMELTADNITQIQGLDQQVSKLFRNFTPATTAHIIEKQINPLDTNIVELNENITKLNEDLGYGETESFSRYLWKLDKANDITKEERAAYIGVYKLINTIEKGDRKAIGAVLKSGEDVTLKNLYRALKNTSFTGSQVTVDDNLGLTESVSINENNLSEQLSYFENMYDGMVDKIWHYTSPKQVKALGTDKITELPLEQVADAINEEDTEDEYQSTRLEDIESARYVSEESLEMLMSSDSGITVSNMLAASYIMNTPGGIWSKLKKDNEELNEVFENIDIENIDEEYDDKLDEAKETLLSQGEKLNVKQFRQFNRVINLMSSMSKKQSYYIPIELNGDTSTIKVTFNNASDDKGKVVIDIYSENAGRIAVEFRKRDDRLSANVLSDSKTGLELAENSIAAMEEDFGEISVEKGIVKNISEGIFAAGESETDISSRSLYRIAKTFIYNIKDN